MKLTRARIGIIQTTCFLTLLSLTSAQAQVQDSLTVEDAVHMAVRNNPSVTKAAAGIAASQARVEQTKTADWPNVGFEGSYERIGPVPELFFPGLGNFKLYPEDNYDAHVGLRQNVFDFGKTSSMTDVAASRVVSARESQELVKANLSYQTIQLFYSILFLQQSIGVEKEDIATLNQHLLVNKKRRDAGSGTDFEVLTTQVRVASAQNQEIDLENMLRKQQIALRRLLGKPDSAALNLRGAFTLKPVPQGGDSLLADALRQRAEYRAAQSEEETSKLQYRSVELFDRPMLSVNAAFGVKNGFIPNLDILRGNWAAGVQLQVPLYEGGLTGYKEQEAQATLLGSRAHVEDVELQISAEVKQALSDLKSAQSKLEAATLQVEEANQALSIAQKRFDAGTVSNLDVLDAETALSQAHLFKLRSVYEYVTSRYALERAIGTRVWE